MAYYHTLGKIPHKRHTIFKSEEGNLYYEQLFGTEGFHGKSSLLYHIHRPTQITKFSEGKDITPEIAVAKNIQPVKLKGFDLSEKDDFLESKTTLFINSNTEIGLAFPKKSMTDYFFKNADADEIHFIHYGDGYLDTLFGRLNFKKGDYIVIPRGTIYQYHFNTEKNKILFIESHSPVEFPKRYTNEFGQLLENSPFCERDLRVPEFTQPVNEKGEFPIKIKKEQTLHTITYQYHPFDVVGWDGYHFPYIFSIYDFEPITGRIHQPPPVHQTFQTNGFVVCSFVPRLFDYHPLSIPAPYNHSNIDSEEMLYYVDGDFMSRNDIGEGQITLHPGGIPHGPHPGAVERSIGAKETNELAVMIDTFQPLKITKAAAKIEDKSYVTSWLEH
ncbi:MAG: homogentisate 1,2-dioxygenase [Bacteroidota bacterium]|nr:homogentisate 1,2-dioxygenase [Bacteroidota bacterium]